MSQVNKITDEDLVAKFSAMEDPAWAQLSAERNHENCIRGARTLFAENAAISRMGFEPNSMASVIYGPGGWHRYFVAADGTIWISVHHMAEGDEHRLALIYKAEALGFGVQW